MNGATTSGQKRRRFRPASDRRIVRTPAQIRKGTRLTGAFGPTLYARLRLDSRLPVARVPCYRAPAGGYCEDILGCRKRSVSGIRQATSSAGTPSARQSRTTLTSSVFRGRRPGPDAYAGHEGSREDPPSWSRRPQAPVSDALRLRRAGPVVRGFPTTAQLFPRTPQLGCSWCRPCVARVLWRP